jgi:hypothetical protein
MSYLITWNLVAGRVRTAACLAAQAPRRLEMAKEMLFEKFGECRTIVRKKIP